MQRHLILLVLFGFMNISFGAVWKVTSTWNSDWENRYSEWVKHEWTPDVFKKGPLKGLATDCADASYSMRALFAYLNGLAFTATSIKGQLLTENLNQFDAIQDADARFQAFLRYVYDLTNTNTLARDTFPVALNRNSLRPGILYVSPGKHSYQIVRISDDGVPLTLSSTGIIENRILIQLDTFPFYRPQSNAFLDGYRAFRWPQEYGLPVTKISRSGLEQFSVPGTVLEFNEAVRKRLAIRDEELSDKIRRNLKNLCHYTRERSPIVVHGFLRRLNANYKCLSGAEYEYYATPSTDQLLKDLFLSVQELMKDPRWSELSRRDKEILESVFFGRAPKELCRVETGLAKLPLISLSDVWTAIQENRLSSNPNHSILARWGQEPPTNDCSQ